MGGVCYHVMNRGNDRAMVFHDERDYQAAVDLIGPACDRLAMRVLDYCLMPNHFHLVLWPHGDGDLGRWMHWLMTSHVRRHHRRHGGSGHVWQGRFKAFPIQRDSHLLTVLRYVERNPVRAELVRLAEQWPWSSAHWLGRRDRPAWLSAWPVPRPRRWRQWVNEPQTAAELATLRLAVARGRPLGDPRWVKRTARRLALEFTLRPPGRPKKHAKK